MNKIVVGSLGWLALAAPLAAAQPPASYGPSNPDAVSSRWFSNIYESDLCDTWVGVETAVYEECRRRTENREWFTPNPDWLATKGEQQKAAIKQRQTETAWKAAQDKTINNAEAIARTYLHDILRDPDSAQWNLISPARPESTAPNAIVIACYAINAKNAYGGYVGYQPYLFQMQYGRVIKHMTPQAGSPVVETEARLINGLCKR